MELCCRLCGLVAGMLEVQVLLVTASRTHTQTRIYTRNHTHTHRESQMRYHWEFHESPPSGTHPQVRGD